MFNSVKTVFLYGGTVDFRKFLNEIKIAKLCITLLFENKKICIDKI